MAKRAIWPLIGVRQRMSRLASAHRRMGFLRPPLLASSSKTAHVFDRNLDSSPDLPAGSGSAVRVRAMYSAEAASFRGISQGWLREMTQAWCWDNLNRFDDFGSFIRAVNEIGYFSEYLRTATPASGHDISTLDRTAITGFAEYVAALVRNGERRSQSKRPGPGDRWNRNMQSNCLFAVQRVLKYGRETDRMNGFAGSFMITDDILVRRVPLVDRDGPGDALPTTVMRQVFSQEYLQRLP